MKIDWLAGLAALLLIMVTAACASTQNSGEHGVERYTEKDVWVGRSGKYDVSVRIQRGIVAGREQCNMREVVMKPAAGLHRRAWGHVRAYDYDCDGRFDNLRFRFPRDQERASTAGERLKLENELWFAFGIVVPVEMQMP